MLAAITCGANEYVAINVCTPCAAGTTNDAGDDASGADTACEGRPGWGCGRRMARLLDVVGIGSAFYRD